MKSIQIFTAMFLFLFATSFTANAQWGKVRGEGKTTTRDLDIDKFQSIGLGISGNLVLTQGSKQSVRVEGQANIIDLIDTDVKSGDWNIKFTERVGSHDKITIYVTMKTLEELSLGGSGNIEATNTFKNLNDVEISLGGSGNISIDIEAEDVECSLGGSGNIELGGSCDELEISMAGSGNIEAFDLSSASCEVSAAGSGDIEVSTEHKLEVSLVGSGDVKYKGSPRVKQTVMGSGSVRQVGKM